MSLRDSIDRPGFAWACLGVVAVLVLGAFWQTPIAILEPIKALVAIGVAYGALRVLSRVVSGSWGPRG